MFNRSAVAIAKSRAPFSSGLGNLTVGKEGSGEAFDINSSWWGEGVLVL